ncbi:MAG: ABC transporter ATP-binding protein [Candidatus Methanosuratincola sp.]|jgi:ABC-2 type transport system ATP-binding protein|nr:ABC transporter ATP-binding protein [Candidatus Methanosuratincola sp.]
MPSYEESAMTDPSIQAVELTKCYNSFCALSGLNLRLEGAKCVGFLGPNGAGKTTALKMLTGMIRPTRGKALINGIDVQENKKAALSTCGALIETPEIYPALSVKEALMMVAEIRGVPSTVRKDAVMKAIAEVKMEEWIDTKCGKLSKGMKQRVNLAAALVSDPIIMLLDEPSSGLDPRGMAEVREIVKGLKKKDRLIFMSSHLLGEVTEICDEVAILDHGKLLAYDKLERLTSALAVGNTKECEASFSRDLGSDALKEIASIEGVTGLELVEPKRLILRLEGGNEAQERALAKIAGLGVGLIAFRPSSSALEETYLRLVKDSR